MCSVVANENPFTVYDRRDGSDYTVRYINGACWMTQNLRITGTVNSQYSNFSTHNNVNVCTNDLSAGLTYNEPRCHDSENTTNGVWYNFAATSAQTITGSSTYDVATEDICPAGWHLPSYNTDSPADSINSVRNYASRFSPVAGGSYGTSLVDTDRGYWWTNTSYYYYSRQSLRFINGALSISDGDSGNRQRGLYIRCVR